ncbi:MAG: nucleotidyltransferase family protein, partial [Prevotella sp.]|nr:nucleotidyltransferase family protein [Candidatus Prevotella equi]
VGVCFAALQRLGANADEGFTHIGISEMLYLTWMGMAAKIQQRNEVMNVSTQKALELFRKDGFECTVLKGQGIAGLYGSFAGLRQSGDIDIWVQGGRKKLYDYSLKTFGKLEGLTYHHIHFPAYEDVEIEAHTWPSFLSSPIRNKRLQEFCKANATNGDTPSLAFNRVFILLHCYQHFTRRGVGMRQLLDYYFVLQQGFTEEERKESMYWIDRLGMLKFCKAMMWIIANVFQKSINHKQYTINLLCEPNEEYGRFLLEEVMQTGNMGHADKRVDHRQLQSAVGRYLFNLKRDMRIIKICPHEALWEPLWGIYQFAWCKLTKMKYKR